MSTRIVETVTGATTEDLRRNRAAAETRADIVELRVDGVERLDLAAVLADRAAPVIVTCRPVWEGGLFDGTEPDRLRILRRARALGAEFIDVEFRADWRSVAGYRDVEGIVLSFHDFSGMPADLETIAEGMAASGADVVKIAVTPARLADCARLAAIGGALRTGAIIGMGACGLATRLAPHRFNACWTYAGSLAALGQTSVAEMRDVYGVGRVSRDAALYGVVGNPILHSRSPLLHNAAFRHASIDALYLPLQAADFNDFLSFADAFDLRGASVTAPYKTDAAAAAASCDAATTAVGAANTLTRRDGHWAAANTDAAGFLDTLQGLEMTGTRAAVIGRGGASRAVAHALTRAGAEVTTLGRADLDRASEPWDLLVNATPVGTSPEVTASVMAGRPIRARRVYDLVYNPAKTQLMRDAETAGAAATGGMDMLVAQACRQFELWFGRPAPVEVYRAAAKEVMHSHETDDIRRVR